MTHTPDSERAATEQAHRLGRQTIDDAATALSTRAQLDQLLLGSLTAPGLAGAQLRELRTYLNGPALAVGQSALERCSRTATQAPA